MNLRRHNSTRSIGECVNHAGGSSSSKPSIGLPIVLLRALKRHAEADDLRVALSSFAQGSRSIPSISSGSSTAGGLSSSVSAVIALAAFSAFGAFLDFGASIASASASGSARYAWTRTPGPVGVSTG